MEVREISIKAEVYRKQGNYNSVIELYKEKWRSEESIFDKWDSWRYASSLRKVGRTSEALEICKSVYKEFPEFIQNVSIYSWCLFDSVKHMRKEEIKDNEDVFLKIASEIVNMTKQGQYSPYEKIVFKVIDYLKDKPSFPYVTVGEWLNKINPDFVSTEASKFIDKDGVERELASNKEKWYALKSKVLERQGNYKECIEICRTALQQIENFHYDYDIWFKNRIAVSKGKLGQREEAIEELSKLLQIKDHWIIQYEITQLYMEIGKMNEALKYAYDAALNANDIKIQLPLFFDMGLILRSKKNMALAEKHISLCKQIRCENNWSIPKELMEQIDFFNLKESNDSAEFIYKQLQKCWLEEKINSIPLIIGEIQSILPNGRAGFINGNDKRRYYFKTKSFLGYRNKLSVGIKVEFGTKKSFDIKRKIESEEAIFIRPQI